VIALMVGRKPGQRVRIGTTTVTVVGVDEHMVSVRIRSGGAFTFTTATERLTLSNEPTIVQARPHPRRQAFACSEPNAPRNTRTVSERRRRER